MARRTVHPGMAEFRRCPECGASVKLSNLAAHYARQHPRAARPLDLGAEEKRAVREDQRRRRTVRSAREARFFLIAAIVVVAIVALAVALPYLTLGPVGRPAPDFQLSTSTGGSMVLSQFRGRVVLLDFMSTTCPYCQAFTTDALVPLGQRYAGRLVLLSIDINRQGDDLATGNARIEQFRTTYGGTWTYALDTAGVTRLYGVTATPTHFIIDKAGVLRDVHAGLEALDAVEGRLAAYW